MSRQEAGKVTFANVSIVGDPATQCIVRSENVLEILAHGGEGGCSIPFEQLNLPALRSLSNQVLEFDMEFLVRPADDEGRHGGIYYGSNQSCRGVGNTVLYWLDRKYDRGYCLYESGSTSPSLLPRTKEPTAHLKIIIKANGEQIVVAGDEIWKSRNVGRAHELDKPYLAFWAWGYNQLRISNFIIRPYTGGELD